MIAALILAVGITAAPGCTAGSEYRPPLCPLHLPPIEAVTVERREGGSACARFRLTPRQVRRYLAHAGTTDIASADATIDRSPCRVAGSVRFAKGRVARWTIEQLRAGTLRFAAGPQQLLYCRGCRFEPFAW